MGPVRHGKRRMSDNSSPAAPRQKRHKHNDPDKESSLGVQKIKASLRQTRRLLAKNNLASDVRVSTERRLKSLEADLERAELARKERTMATKYHMVKFFEKQKISRKIAQVKKKMAAHNDNDSQEALQSQLEKLRIDLNYILHYPKTKKYISLFPPEVRHGDPSSSPESEKTQASRAELRESVRERMSNGEISSEPELHHDHTTGHSSTHATPSHKHKPAASSRIERKKASPEVEEEADDFFGEDDDDSE